MASKAPKSETHNQGPKPVTHIQDEKENTDKGKGQIFADVVNAVRPLLGHTRLNEKNALVGLNNRLATIIEKNQQLEKENGNLTQKIVTVEEEKKSSLVRCETTFKKERDNYQKQLADAEKLNKKLTLEDVRLKSELDDLKQKLARKDDEIKKANEALNKLKKDNDRLVSDLKKSEDENDKLKKDKKIAEDLNNKKDKEIAKVREDLEKEALAKIDTENKLKSRENEFDVKYQLIEQEVQEFKARREVEMKELDGKLQNEYDTKLQQVLDDLRAEYEKQLQTNKEVQNDLFKKKESDMKAQLDRLKAEVDTKTKSLKDIAKKLDDATEKVAKLEGDKAGLSKINEDLKKKMKEERVRLDQEKKKKDQENLEIQTQKEKLISEYSDLMEIKIMLDNEIATYRAMLEGEESRLHLTSDENMNVPEVSPIKTPAAAAVPSQ